MFYEFVLFQTSTFGKYVGWKQFDARLYGAAIWVPHARWYSMLYNRRASSTEYLRVAVTWYVYTAYIIIYGIKHIAFFKNYSLPSLV